MKKIVLVLALAASLLSLPAYGQAVQQSGNVTPGHIARWTSNGVVSDGGTAANGSITSIGVTASGPAICQNSAATTTVGWQRLCFGVTTSGGAEISTQNFGTATAQPLAISVNGTTAASITASGISIPVAITSTAGGILVGAATTGGNKGSGTINAAAIYVNGSAVGGGGGGDTLTVGTTVVSNGVTNGLLYNSGGVLGNLASGASGVLITSSGSVPSISSTLPTTVQNNITQTGTLSSKVITTDTTNITEPNGTPAVWTAASGALQVRGGASIDKELQIQGGRIFLGDGSATTGFNGAVVLNMNGYNATSIGGTCFDMDNVLFYKVRLGTFGTCTNGLITTINGQAYTAVYDDRLVLLSSRTTGNMMMFGKYVDSIPGTLTTALILNADLTSEFGGALAGGALTSSTLTLRSTNGVGATDKIIFQTGSQSTRGTMLSSGFLGLGTETNPQNYLTVSGNVTTGLADPAGVANTILLAGTDGQSAGFTATAYGAGVPGYTLARAKGTALNKTVIASGDTLGTFFANGYDGSAYQNGPGFFFVAGQTWATGPLKVGSYIDVYTAPNDATSIARAVRFQGSSGLSVGTTTDPGAGAIIANTAVFASTYVAVGTKIRAQGTAPALTSCGGGSPAITGSDLAGEVTMGTTATGCVITFNAVYASTPYCTVSWQATPLASQSYAVSTAAITLTQTSASGNKVNYTCVARSAG